MRRVEKKEKACIAVELQSRLERATSAEDAVAILRLLLKNNEDVICSVIGLIQDFL